MKKIKIVVLGPAWATKAVLQTTVKRLAQLGYEVSIAPYRGHYGDTADLSGVTLEDFEDDAWAHIQQIITEEEKIILLGISMGGVLAHRIADKHPESIEGVIMYGTPMFTRVPVWTTLLRIVLNWKYLKAIVTGKGTLSLLRGDAEDFLFEGMSRTEVMEVLQQPASSKALKQMLTGTLTPNKTSTVPHVVFTCIKELFHRNQAAFRFAKKQGSKVGQTGKFYDVEGGHFSGLFKDDWLHMLREALEHIHAKS